jgi:hypothetical protein
MLCRHHHERDVDDLRTFSCSSHAPESDVDIWSVRLAAMGC